MNRRIPALALALAALPIAADTPKISGLLQIWGTQMLDNNIRLNSNAVPGGKYYDPTGNFAENTFTIRRAEIKLAGEIMPGVEWDVMIDPSITTSAGNPQILQDALIHYKTGFGLDVKVGQFKTFQTYEGLMSSAELTFAERAQMTRRFGDKRDRGVAFGYAFGDPKSFSGKATFGIFNGMTDLNSGKSNDSNAQKDLVFRLDFAYGKAHKFGVYTLQGATDQADKGTLAAKTFAGTSVPTAAEILDNKDKTTNLGAFYVFNNGTWGFMGEYATGLLGRRFASVGAAGAAGRQHLDQKYAGLALTGSYTTGAHTFAVRYDQLNYNSDDQWYTATDPYVTAAGDYSPKFTEITAGYTYAFNPKKLKAANIKMNYINRSKNFLLPRAGQTGEQGGDSLVLAFQIAF